MRDPTDTHCIFIVDNMHFTYLEVSWYFFVSYEYGYFFFHFLLFHFFHTLVGANVSFHTSFLTDRFPYNVGLCTYLCNIPSDNSISSAANLSQLSVMYLCVFEVDHRLFFATVLHSFVLIVPPPSALCPFEC